MPRRNKSRRAGLKGQVAEFLTFLSQLRISTVDDSNTTLVAEIVSAYVSNNSVAVADLSRIIGDVHAAVQRLATNEPFAAPPEVKPVPAVPVKKSVTPDFIYCLDDGKKFKSLKRHLATAFNMTPDEYRAKWDLPPSYPMVAPNYAARRSAVAKELGLGQSRKRAVAMKGTAKSVSRKH
ncbi:MucR family transcriptional regulator [Labrys monachus]|uniref:Transcriptional regulator n=1 Tax=Labrys monachus TaxID=217067 RepID=A0ABU0FJ27_9HYPH|nr:MucR family transcriptional regulator [Labrys monachus]MDQ0394613.1 putative transcriptional regulator [Labrys monachus]